jgi:hypothetical protein
MMPNYAIIINDLVTNVVLADSKSIAEELNPGAVVVDASINSLGVGHFKEGTVWYPKKPFNSWVWSESRWFAPKPYPTDDKIYNWDESVLDWVEVITE